MVAGPAELSRCRVRMMLAAGVAGAEAGCWLSVCWARACRMLGCVGRRVVAGFEEACAGFRGEGIGPAAAMCADGLMGRIDGAVWLAALGRRSEGTSSGSVKPGSARS